MTNCGRAASAERIRTFNAGLSNAVSRAYFAPGDDSCNTRLSDANEVGGTMVQTVRIDFALLDCRVSFIKMDIEGAEPLA